MPLIGVAEKKTFSQYTYGSHKQIYRRKDVDCGRIGLVFVLIY